MLWATTHTCAPLGAATAEALAWTPTTRDQADFAAYKCGDAFPDVTDQPLITCDREGTTKFLLAPVVLKGSQLT
ncbi:MAG TPA: hypothetical protein PLS63_06980, partial [Microthrixaceae bacterium]|nr:hypothetical protein [Microthrixaceae bacterium]